MKSKNSSRVLPSRYYFSLGTLISLIFAAHLFLSACQLEEKITADEKRGSAEERLRLLCDALSKETGEEYSPIIGRYDPVLSSVQENPPLQRIGKFEWHFYIENEEGRHFLHLRFDLDDSGVEKIKETVLSTFGYNILNPRSDPKAIIGICATQNPQELLFGDPETMTKIKDLK